MSRIVTSGRSGVHLPDVGLQVLFCRRSVRFGRAPIVVDMRADFRVEEAEGAVPDEDKKRAAFQALVDRVLHGAGKSSPEQRGRAFSNADIPQPLESLLGKVAARPAEVTDADFAAAKAAGYTEDQLFEMVVAAAVGQSARQYEAGLAALSEAAGEGEAGS